jgi:hypothetical protein
VIDVDALCFLISRLTPAQRSVLADLAAHASAWWDVGEPSLDGIVEGLCRLGLIERHPAIRLLYRVTVLGLLVLEVLIDTEVVG